MITAREGTILPGTWECLLSLEKRGGIVMKIERQGTFRQNVKYRGVKYVGPQVDGTQMQSTESAYVCTQTQCPRQACEMGIVKPFIHRIVRLKWYKKIL